jgi:serine protease AprX
MTATALRGPTGPTALTLRAGVARRLALGTVAALAAALAVSPMGGTPSPVAEQVTYVVRTAPGAAAEVATAAAGAGAVVERTLQGIDAVIVKATAAQAAVLGRTGGVSGVTPDAPLRPKAYDPVSDGTSLLNVQQATGVRQQWRNGMTGAGIGVAVVDSGVNRVKGLDAPGKVYYGPDFTPEASDPARKNLDGYGHGTHMAGIIAGQDPGFEGWNPNPQAFYGVAPQSHIVSVKVADGVGNTTVSAVMSGLDWVLQNRWVDNQNIRVVNLSFGTDSTQSYTVDPLAHATEKLWKAGLAVVVSAGNDGTTYGQLDNPARDPYVIAVGAADTRGTLSTTDDTVPGFSSRGNGTRNPDVLAPGRGIQSLRVPGSYVDVNYGSTGTLNDRFFRGSGTSQAAAFVSGVVAQLIQRGLYHPDDMKASLTSNATKLTGHDAKAQGNGLVNVDKALANAKWGSAAQSHPSSTGTGSLDAAGDVDVAGRSWKGRSWKSDAWAWSLG